MNAIPTLLRKAGFAMVALSAIGSWQAAHAAGTASGTTINNKATINYTIGGVGQVPIESSPSGNSTPGVNNGTNTAFLVDTKVDFTVVELSGANTVVNPGQTGAVVAYTVTNTSNATLGFALGAANETGTVLFGNTDNINIATYQVYVDSNNNDVYDPGVDTAANINSLAADGDVTVFIVSTIPLSAANGDFANMALTAQGAVAGTNGGTLLVETAGADNPNAVDIVFADAGRNNSETDNDQYAVQSAALTVAKTSAVTWDPFNLAVNPKAIPGAQVEYTINVTNTGVVAASGVQVGDPLPANTTFVPDAYNGGASNVSITVGVNPASFCFAEAGGSDLNSDGCVISGGSLQVGSPALGSVATGPSNAVAVRFKVEIN